MAKLTLDSYRGDAEELPEVCMKCGEAATQFKRRTFSWYPPWTAVLLVAGLVPFAIVAILMTKKSRVEVPLCDAHKNHWLMRQLLSIGSFFALVLFLAITIGVAVAIGDDNRGENVLMPFVCGGNAILFLGWLILAIILQNTAIRPTEITEDSITLTSVSDAFVEAYKAERPRGRRDIDRMASERWNDRGGKSRRSVRRPAEDYDEDDDEGGTDAYRRR